MKRKPLTGAIWWLAANIGAIGVVHLLAIWRPLCGLALPLVLGSAQALALRGQVRPALWAFATVGGFVAAIIAGGVMTIAFDIMLLEFHLALPVPLLAAFSWLTGAIGGAVAGAVQIFLAGGDPQARPWGRRAWIVASAMGGVVLLPGLTGLALRLIQVGQRYLGPSLADVAWAAVGAVTYSAITGYVLITATPAHRDGGTAAEILL